eukprot:scaffold203531_cov53-Attheya_sp.AAC.1
MTATDQDTMVCGCFSRYLCVESMIFSSRCAQLEGQSLLHLVATNKSRKTSDSLSLMLPKSVRVLDMGAHGHSRRSGWRERCEIVLVGQHPPA